jgi:cytochrome b561
MRTALSATVSLLFRCKPLMESAPLSNTRPPSAVSASASTVYSYAMRVLHWVTAVLIMIAIPLAWYASTLDRKAPMRDALVNLHRSMGFTILVLTLLRIAARARRAAPPLPHRIPLFERGMAHIAHALLYVILLVMPISGYINSYASGHWINWFWLFRVLSVVPHERPLAHLGSEIHHFVAWLTYLLIAGHLAAIAYHQYIERIDLLSRITGRCSGSPDK